MAANSEADRTRTCARCQAEIPPGAAFCANCGASTAPGRSTGPVIAGYSILRILGQGGAAVVYLAEQEALDRRVAVKVLRHDVENPKVWRNFRREARTIARLSAHPNVVTVFTAGRSEAGQPYLVTEYLDRGSLGDVIAAEGPWPPAEVAQLGIAVADALTAAHGLGILHRDVKPANVLLDHDGRVKLGDFGIARLLAGQTVTTTDVVAFTPEHVAPEVLRGEPDGPWSDVYGLASTLVTALVGTSLFTRRPDERVEALLSRKVMSPPPVLPASVPPALAGPITRALDPDPSRRPELSEFRRLLAAAAGSMGAAVPLPPPMAPMAAETVEDPVPPTLADDSADEPMRPLIGPLRRPRSHWLAGAAVLIALLVAGLVIAALVRGGGDAGGAANTTNPIAIPPTDGGATTAQPSAVPASTSSAQITSAAPTSAPAPQPPVSRPPLPTTTAAPTTTVPPETAPPPTTAPPTAPAGGLEQITTPEVETFVRSYYDAVDAGNYDVSWSQLAPEFQQGMAISYEYYVDFWDENDIEVGAVELVDADQDRALVNVELSWNGSSGSQTDQFTLRPGENGQLLIAAQDTVSG